MNDPRKDKRKPYTLEEFIERCKFHHGDKYDYSLVEYVNNKTDVTLICPKHGNFTIKPQSLTSSRAHGCQKCGVEQRAKKRALTKEEFIKKAQILHGDKYDYSLVEYKNGHTLVILICPNHGEFKLRPQEHISKRQYGCKRCHMSKGEGKILRYLQGNNIEFIYQKSYLSEKRIFFDFLIPKNNLHIEFDGRQHFEDWHFGKVETVHENDKSKDLFIKENNTHLLRIHHKDFSRIEEILDFFLQKSTYQVVEYSRPDYYHSLKLQHNQIAGNSLEP